MKHKDDWNAFCTVHWFATGCRIIQKTTNKPLTHQLYAWYLGVFYN